MATATTAVQATAPQQQQQQQVIPCGSYDIVLGTSLLSSSFVAQDILRLLPTTSTFVILTDTNVFPLYALPLYQQLRALLAQHNATHGATAPKRVLIHPIPAGEASKSREMKAKIEDEVFFHNRCHRDSCVIAVGGGVVGDLSGYVASTYMRGVPFIQVPTSLLACVDSSIGGKTGIDVEEYGKNLLGAFHMPERVYIDLSVLKTLPKRELINGMGEVIKAGAIFDAELFDLLEISTDAILNLSDMALVQRVVAAAVQVKATVVTQDTKEMGLRAILNFGHSIGHGIEALVQPEYLHGECVSIGMIKEAEIARGMGLCSSATVGRLRRCLTAYGLPVRVPEGVKTQDVIVKMEVDKKNSQGVKKIILLQSIGTVLSNPYTRAIKDEQIALVLEKQVAMVPGTLAQGRVRVPGSKSISNRVLLMAALGQGPCRITGLLHSDDTQVMMNALQKVGAKFTWEDDGAVLVVEGTGGAFQEVADMEEIYLSNAGTAARFLTTTMTLVKANGGEGRVVVTGNSRMKERPIAPLVKALQANGCDIEYLEGEGCPPLAIKYTGLAGGAIPLAAKVSSQYVSSVLITAPYAKQPVELILDEENPTSLPYIEMTTLLMKDFGIEVETIAANHYRVPCGVYKNPAEFSVEVDASSATYPLALAAITGGSVTLEALGKHSLQGDAAFHTLCTAMGCTSSQDATTTTVTGPPKGTPLQAVEIDMETMTDAFMTAVALAAVAKGTTKITGIANQRVKECNRIEVMVTGLRQLGVECGELEDGMWITGTAGEVSHLKKAYIECHNDHRIAMSFAVLGAVVPNIVITDKECTDKTYPEYWDHVSRFLGLKVAPVIETEAEMTGDDAQPPAVFLIGMRGAGKSSMAHAASQALGMKLLDMDDEISKQLGESIASYVAKPGVTWADFRVKEREFLLPLIANSPKNTIISCGGGVVESAEIVHALSAYPYVVHVHRAIGDVLAQLEEAEKAAHRPSLGETNDVVWARRQPLYTKSSAFEFNVNAGDSDVTRIGRDFVRFLSVVVPHSPASFNHKALARDDSFFLSLTFPDLKDAVSLIPQVTQDVDAVELRVDLLKDFRDTVFIQQQVALLRAVCPLPIIYTVRSQNQGGAFPDDDEEFMFELLHLGVRLGCEFVDLETCWSITQRRKLVAQRRQTAIISSFHAVQTRVSEEELRAIFRECYAGGSVQIVKVVIKAFEADDALLVDRVAKYFYQAWQKTMPVISLATTGKGKMARVLNRVLTPVTHALLPAAAAPGQLSVEEIMGLRKQLGLLEGRSFFLFGSPISKSPSPSMHNAAFRVHGLPFEYALCDTTDVADIVSLMQNATTNNFGGGSVTIPLKVDVMSHVNELSAAARAIGAVNTLTRSDLSDGSVHWKGDNTDWLGIYRPIHKRLQGSASSLTALVVGAGGTSMAAAYAMRQLGVEQLFIYNRTLSKAEEVAARFEATPLAELTPETLAKVDIVVSTVPAQANFTLPEYLLKNNRVIVLDAAYMPPITPCLAHADALGAVCIQGYEMLYEQAFEQYKRWHKATQAWPVDVAVLQQACLVHIPTEQRLY